MLLCQWLRSFADRLRRRIGGRRLVPRRAMRRMSFERLEERTLLTTLTVNSLADNAIGGNGQVTLREAVIAALTDTATDLGQTGSGNDKIVFQAGLNGDVDINFANGSIGGSLNAGQNLTITGNGSANTAIDGQNLGRPLVFIGNGGHLVLDSLTVKNGRTTLNTYGGGALAAGGYAAVPMSVTISNSTFSGNSTTGQNANGGAIYTTLNGGTLFILNSTITGNSTTGQNSDGGAVYVKGGNLVVGGAVGSVFTNNSTTGAYANSGAIHLQSNNVNPQVAYIVNSQFTGNSAQNSSNAGAAYAGAIGQYGTAPAGSSLTITTSSVSGNTAGGGGGGVSTYNMPLTVVSSTISGNNAGGAGGGIFSATASVVAFQSTISGNTAGANGGGIDMTGVNAGGLALYSCTITLNQAGGNAYSGGGIGANPASGLNLGITNSIIAQNLGTANGTDLVAASGTVVVVANSLIGNNSATGLAATGGAVGANGNIVGTAAALVNPQLAPLANMGGLAPTHALLANSPAINRGNNAFSGGAVVDQRGAPFARIFGGTVDIGAVEFQPLQSIVGSVATFAGTGAVDRFVTNLNNRTMTANTQAYVLPAAVNNLQIDGLGGSDVLTLVGTAGAETVRLAPGLSFLDNSSAGFTGQFNNIETIAHHGSGGADAVTFTDSTANDRFIGRSNLKRMIGTGFDLIFVGAGAIVGNATAGGIDTAFLFDTAGNDVFNASAAAASITNTNVTANGFETAVGFGSGGNDSAVLTGSPSRDVFLGRFNRSSLTGGGLTLVAVGIDQVTANPAGGSDIARLFGNAGFDTFTASPVTARLVGAGFQLDANNFETVVGTASGVGDVAALTDSAGDDLFVGTGNTGSLINSISNYTAVGFATVTINGINGGNNRLALTQPLGFTLLQVGTWV